MEEETNKSIKVPKNIKFNLLEVIIIMIITIIFSIVLGTLITTSKEYNHDFNSNYDEEIAIFKEAYNKIVDEYYETVDKKVLIEKAINGMFNYLGDPYSTYMNEEETEALMERLNGEYAGVGMEITANADGTANVVRIFKNSPASETDIKPGDKITLIDDQSLTDLSISEIANLIKGPINTKVKINTISDNEEKEYVITRKSVNIDSITYKLINNNQKISYISIDLFAANTNDQFKKALDTAFKDGVTGLIIDVRNNTGGYLDTVSDMASQFMDRSHIIYQLQTKDKISKIYSTEKKNLNVDVVVLINEISASASEILAAALQESYGALIVGTQSYGKGTVQKATTLRNGATLKYTIQKWLTPNGNWINETGITPTHYIELNEEYFKNPIEENDNQLQEAIKLLTK